MFDFCQNMAGFATLSAPEGADVVAGKAIRMLHAEALHGPPENHSAVFQHYGCDQDTLGKSCMELNTYLTKGEGAAINYTPLFTYAGFRYIQMTGYPGTPDTSALTAHFVHTDFQLDGGAISFSDPMLDAVQRITRASARSNFMYAPPSHRHLVESRVLMVLMEYSTTSTALSSRYESYVRQYGSSRVGDKLRLPLC